MYIDYDTIINSGVSISNALQQTVEAVEQLKKDIAVLRSRMTVAEGELAAAPATSAQSEIPNSKSDLEIFGGIGKRRELPLLDDYADIDKWYNDFLKGL